LPVTLFRLFPFLHTKKQEPMSYYAHLRNIVHTVLSYVQHVDRYTLGHTLWAIVSTILPACVTYFGGECSYVIELQKLSSAIYHIFVFDEIRKIANCWLFADRF
jgi:hypothetical protein